MCKNSILFILLFSLIFLLLFPGCQPSTSPGLTGGAISGQAALPGSSSKDITGYTPISGATVTVIDAEGNIHTTLTDSNGFYSFDNITVKANTIINITKDTTGGGKIVFMEVIPQALSPEENFYAGIADAESTALALVIEALINLGQLQEEINLEEIISAPGFAQLEEAIRQAQGNNQDILTLSSIITQAQAIADYIVNPPPVPTPSPPPTPTYTVTFDSQGGSAVASQTVAHGGKVTEPTEPTRTSYTFGGWYKESGCTNAWNFDTDTVTANVTLYAKWTINSYTVIYNGNGSTGGTVPTDANNYEEGATVTVLGNTGTLAKTGYIFDGWNTAADGGGTDQAVSSIFVMGASNVTLYAKWTPLYALRDTGPEGGLIFYVKEGGYSDGWMYLEAAPNDQDYEGDYTVEWGCSGTSISGSDGILVGTGEQNTIDIENGCTTAGTAADICANLTLGDWFLPSKDELNLMYTNLKIAGVGGFTDDFYWSSSEYGASYAWFQYFPNGTKSYTSKANYLRVRAVRAF